MRFENPTKLELFLDGFRNFWNCLDCYNDGDTWGYEEFWEGLNLGFYMEYVYKFEEFWGKGSYPPEHMFLKPGDFDALVEKLSLPSEATMESIKRLANRKKPWNEE